MKLVQGKRGRRFQSAEQAIEEIKSQAEQWVEETRQGFVEARSKFDAELESARASIADLERALESERRQRAELERQLERQAGPTPAVKTDATRMDRPQRWAAAKELAAQGFSQREIARRLGINRRTVARLVASDEPPRYRRAPQGSMLDPLEPVMRSVLRDRPGIDASAMTEILREHGYRGSVDLVRRRLRRLRTPG
jgi:predicted transcriptional regulator